MSREGRATAITIGVVCGVVVVRGFPSAAAAVATSARDNARTFFSAIASPRLPLLPLPSTQLLGLLLLLPATLLLPALVGAVLPPV